MRIDSCRSCGNEMFPLNKCDVCQLRSFKCSKCGNVTDALAHTHAAA